MVKAPSSHGLDRKFKPWRRGKSSKGKHGCKSTTSSLKQQLRGLQRLYDKKKDGEDVSELGIRIKSIQEQIEGSNQCQKERENAKKSHKMRFLERQRTTRQHKQLISNGSNPHELYKLALDQVYIAHYPMDTSYLSLYRDGVRRQVVNDRLLFKMALQRRRVLERLKSSSVERVSWIPESQYELVQSQKNLQWSTKMERETFEIKSEEEQEVKREQVTDDRFQVTDSAQELIEQQKKLEKELEDEDGKPSSRDPTKSTSDEDDDAADSATHSDVDHDQKLSSESKVEDTDKRSESDDDDDDDDDSKDESSTSESSTSEDDEIEDASKDQGPRGVQKNRSEPSKLGDVNSREDKETLDKKERPGHVDDPTDSVLEDGFLVATEQDVADVFAKAKHHAPSLDEARGNKSKGWATQRQLPGQVRKKPRR